MSEMDAAVRQQLAAVSTATLTTCLFKRGFRNAYLQDVHPLNPKGRPMVGPAFTLRYIPAREDLDTMAVYADFEHPQRKAIETCPAGHVLVMDSRKDARAGSAGDILVARLMMRGVAGVVTDGGFRDAPTIATLDIPAYHQRPAAPTGPILHHATEFGLPIACGGVAIYPGDIMVGDGEGVVCLPAHLAAELADEAVEMTANEDFVTDEIKAGKSIFGTYPATDASRARFAAWRTANGR